MILMTLAEIAEVTGGRVHGDRAVTVTAPATVDSRSAEPGGLFVAVPGERVDGHDFADAAVAGGAAAVLGSRATAAPTVVVDDPVAALGLLARHVRDRLPGCTVLALTGSQGKTGTKDYLAQLLATAGPTVATAGNLNNEIGVPLTVLRAGEDTRFLVVEMGARGIGHIAYLCEVARPTVAAVLNVGTAHMSEFGTREAIARAKGEIVECLPADGVAVLNADDPLVAAMRDRTAARVVWFGETAETGEADRAGGADEAGAATLAFDSVRLDELGRPSATFRWRDEAHGHAHADTAEVALRDPGRHQVANAAAATALALSVGLGLGDAAAALGKATSLSRWRMELTEVPGGPVVVNDAYNANPASMRAGLDALASIGRSSGRRTVAVLGEMKELGPDAEAEHRGVGAYAARLGVDVLLAVGAAARPLLDGARAEDAWSGTAVSSEGRDEALAWLRENVAAGDVVLVKASRGAALETVAQGLVEGTPDE